MLDWMTRREYNRIDLFWVSWFLLAWFEHKYLISIACIIAGAIISGSLEYFAKAKNQAPAK